MKCYSLVVYLRVEINLSLEIRIYQNCPHFCLLGTFENVLGAGLNFLSTSCESYDIFVVQFMSTVAQW